MVADDPRSVTAAVEELFASPELRASLAAAGRETAAKYAWERRIDALEKIYLDLAQSAPVGLTRAGG
jgi:glycosyltransferase involved in cell wall biosynthesis